MKSATLKILLLILMLFLWKPEAAAYVPSGPEHDWVVSGPMGQWGLLQYGGTTSVYLGKYRFTVPLSAPVVVGLLSAILAILMVCAPLALQRRSDPQEE